jgi:hypothetical protein
MGKCVLCKRDFPNQYVLDRHACPALSPREPAKPWFWRVVMQVILLACVSLITWMCFVEYYAISHSIEWKGGRLPGLIRVGGGISSLSPVVFIVCWWRYVPLVERRWAKLVIVAIAFMIWAGMMPTF